MIRAGRAHITIESPKEPYQHITKVLQYSANTAH